MRHPGRGSENGGLNLFRNLPVTLRLSLEKPLLAEGFFIGGSGICA